MSADRRLDYESFQKLLANAYSVQESGIDARSLAAFVRIQRSITNGNCGVNEAMNLVVNHAREVANAMGVAIAVLKAGQLVYRAGSGSATGQVGRHLTAVLSSPDNARKEILRVENAETDSRIEAEICRQYGGTSLLMLPIYGEHVVIGVMEVIFSAQHSFQDKEVRAYQLLAGLVEEAMSRAARARASEEEEPKPVVGVVEDIPAQVREFRNEESAPAVSVKLWVRQLCAAAGLGPSIARAWAKAAASAAVLERNAFLSGVWRKSIAGAAVSALVIIGWTAYVHHRSLRTGTVMESSNPAAPLALPGTSNPLSTVPPETRVGARMANGQAFSGFRRKRISANEVDYFADDVTMRVFTPQHKTGSTQLWSRQVKYGDDVTMRYFTSQPARPVVSASDQSDHSSSVSK